MGAVKGQSGQIRLTTIEFHPASPENLESNGAMKQSVLLLVVFIFSCQSRRTVGPPAHDDRSINSEVVDSSLLGLPLRDAIAKLGIDSRQFFVIEEPPFALRGIMWQTDSLHEVRLLTGRLSIRHLWNSTDSLQQDSLKFRNKYRFLLDRQITGIVWTSDGGRTVNEVYRHSP
jgi:hypothetical protein